MRLIRLIRESLLLLPLQQCVVVCEAIKEHTHIRRRTNGKLHQKLKQVLQNCYTNPEGGGVIFAVAYPDMLKIVTLTSQLILFLSHTTAPEEDILVENALAQM